MAKPNKSPGLSELGARKRYDYRGWLAIVRGALESSETIGEAAEKLGLGWRQVHRWLKADPKLQDLRAKFRRGGYRR